MVLMLRGDAAHLPLPDACIDAVVCDPPYADQLTMFGKRLATVPEHDGASVEENVWAWTMTWATELFRVVKPNGTLFVFSSAPTFRFLSSEVPPFLLGLTSDGDMTWHVSPTRRDGALDAVGFRFQRLHKWVYGTGNPRGTDLKPAWEAIVEVRKDLRPRPPIPTIRIDLFAALRERLPRLEAEQRSVAERILSTPHYDPLELWEHPLFQGVFDDVRPELTLADFRDGWCETWEPGEDFYVPKPSVAEQNEGLADLPKRRVTKFGPAKMPRQNTHPTPKAVKLMRMLVALACPTGGLVLDPFAGSGTTGMACAYEGRRFIGIERDMEYLPIAARRLAYAQRLAGITAVRPT